VNANELLFYLRGFAELVATPSEAQWSALRNEILQAKPISLPNLVLPAQPCGCKGEKDGH